MKKFILKNLVLGFVFLLILCAVFFLLMHPIMDLLWIYSYAAVGTFLRALLIKYFAAPFLAVMMMIVACLHHFLVSPKKIRWNRKYLFFKLFFVFFFCLVTEFLLKNSELLLSAIFGGVTGVEDPLTHLDISLYLFWLPLLKNASIFLSLYFLVLISLENFHKKENISSLDRFLFLLSMFLFGIFLIIFRFESIASHIKSPYIGYINIYGKFIPFILMVGWFFFGAILLFFVGPKRKIFLVYLGMSVFVLLITNIFWPAYLKRFIFDPNESALQESFAAIHAESTRKAFGLEGIYRDESLLLQNSDLEEIIRTNFWQDYLHFVKGIRHNQEILPIFKIDRAHTMLLKDKDGRYNPCYIASRDIEEDVADSWDVKHLRKIFGYGAVIGKANEFDSEGFPQLIVKDLSISSRDADIKIKNPQIFFGESYKNYALINTKMLIPNFKKSSFVLESQIFKGIQSIPLNIFTKILLALVFKDTKIFLTDYFTPETRILLLRKPKEIVKKLLPRFFYSEPRLVYHDEGLWWEMDVYSCSKGVLTAKMVSTPWGEYNWVRSPMKAYISAYSGELFFDILDEKDPMVRVVKKIYPGLFKETIEISSDQYLYPKDLFDIQSHILEFYHERNASSFYAGLNKRQISEKLNSDEKESIKKRFLLNQKKIAYQRTYTPLNKNIFSAQLTGYLNNKKEKILHLYEMPAEYGVPGLAQSESFLNQDPDFSRLKTLWGQRGSLVSGSDTSFYPVDREGIYLRTIFLESESISIPLATRFILIDKTTIGMASTIKELSQKARGVVLSSRIKTSRDGKDLTAEISTLYQYYLQAEKERVDGNTKEYQRNVDKIGEGLQQLSE